MALALQACTETSVQFENDAINFLTSALPPAVRNSLIESLDRLGEFFEANFGNKQQKTQRRIRVRQSSACQAKCGQGLETSLSVAESSGKKDSSRGNPAPQASAAGPELAPAVLMVHNIIAGTLARTLAQGFIHPIDTLKTRLQVTATIPALQNWQKVVGQTARTVNLLGLKFQWCDYLHFGIKDVYVGLGGSIAGTLPTAFVYFVTSEFCKAMFEKRGMKRTAMVPHMVSSAAAAFTSAFIRVPSDVLKHRVQAYVYPDVGAAARDVIAKKGFSGFYAGFGATLLRDVPEMVVQFTVYEILAKALDGYQAHKAEKDKIAGASRHLLLGGAAGAVAAFVTNPLDVIKTQLQCAGGKSVPSAFAEVVSTRGLPGLFAGLGPRLLQQTIMSAAFFAIFESIKHSLKDYHVAQGARKPKVTIEEVTTPLTVKPAASK